MFGAGDILVGKLDTELSFAGKKDKTVVLVQDDACCNWESTRCYGDMWVGPSAQSEGGRGARRPPGVVKLSEGWGRYSHAKRSRGRSMHKASRQERTLVWSTERTSVFWSRKKQNCKRRPEKKPLKQV